MGQPAVIYPRRIFCVVTGMSPQVVTETLFALKERGDLPPTEIHILTTKLGRNRAIRDLLDPEDGQFLKFYREFGYEGLIAFNEASIEAITSPEGVEMNDIRLLLKIC